MPYAILIGPPGSGKSRVGRALANTLGVGFIDSDSVVEKKSGRKISDIFVDDGEAVFRDLEFEVLTSSLKDKSSVLSLGGGAPISQRSQTALTGTGYPIVFLE